MDAHQFSLQREIAELQSKIQESESKRAELAAERSESLQTIQRLEAQLEKSLALQEKNRRSCKNAAARERRLKNKMPLIPRNSHII